MKGVAGCLFLLGLIAGAIAQTTEWQIQDSVFARAGDEVGPVRQVIITADADGLIRQVQIPAAGTAIKARRIAVQRTADGVRWVDDCPGQGRDVVTLVRQGNTLIQTVQSSAVGVQPSVVQQTIRVLFRDGVLWEDAGRRVLSAQPGSLREVALKPDSAYRFVPTYSFIEGAELHEWYRGRLNSRERFQRVGERLEAIYYLQPGEDETWVASGWTRFSGRLPRSQDPVITVINDYLLKTVFAIPVYRPFLLGWKVLD